MGLIRGICLDATDARLVIEASPEDVRQVTVGAAYGIAQWAVPVAFAAQAPRYVPAILHTACGCTREVSMSWPPQREVRVPIAMPTRGFSAVPDPTEPLTVSTRVFRLYDIRPGEHGDAQAHYREEA